jgi:hypothetical protein
MRLRLFPIAALAIFFSASALAGHCPSDVKAIDAAIEAGTDLSEAQLAEVKELRDEGEKLHKDGSHAESIEALHKAMDILGLEHPS